MCVNVFLVVKGFLMLIWVMVEVDVCVSVCERPVPICTFTFREFEGVISYVIANVLGTPYSVSGLKLTYIEIIRADHWAVPHRMHDSVPLYSVLCTLRTNIVHYSLYKLLRYTDKSIRTKL